MLFLPITTPGLFFPAISLMMLARTNRFPAPASLTRSFRDKYKNESREQHIVAQIRNLRRRMKLIRALQIFGLLSFLLCAVCMFCIIREWNLLADTIFIASIIAFILSLFLSLLEIILSLEALEAALSDMEELSEKIKKI